MKAEGHWELRSQVAGRQAGRPARPSGLTEARQQAQECILVSLLGDVQDVVQSHLTSHALLLQKPACKEPRPLISPPRSTLTCSPALLPPQHCPGVLLGETFRKRVGVRDWGFLLSWKLLIYVESVVIHHEGHEHWQELGDELCLLAEGVSEPTKVPLTPAALNLHPSPLCPVHTLPLPTRYTFLKFSSLRH